MNISRTLTQLLLAAAASISMTNPVQAADVGVSISVGQPGFYGRIDIGDYPQPYLIYPEPRVIYQPRGVVYEPIYVHAPPGHVKHWRRYCSQYHACDRPVYFVQDQWYDEVYVPGYRERHDEYRDHPREGDHDRGNHDGGDHERGHGNKDREHGRGHDQD